MEYLNHELWSDSCQQKVTVLPKTHTCLKPTYETRYLVYLKTKSESMIPQCKGTVSKYKY